MPQWLLLTDSEFFNEEEVDVLPATLELLTKYFM